ncbi:MAG: ATP phosphoribosyltransferase, partial [Burkholderiales bacterium]|nr:ATP phosphoribosyltransferase [Anaerolineae bacterium]
RENHLKALGDGVIVKSQACLIGNRDVLRANPKMLDTVRMFLEYVDGAMHGRRYYQVTANVRGIDAEDVAHKVASNPLTQGLQGPTIAPIYGVPANGSQPSAHQWYTVTIIIASNHMLPAVEHLRAIGGTQTIAVPVHYVFLENSPTFLHLLEQL